MEECRLTAARVPIVIAMATGAAVPEAVRTKMEEASKAVER